MDSRDNDGSSFEDPEHSPSRPGAKRQGGRASRDSFESRVLAMLGDLTSDMQSIGERVSKLEGKQTQSVFSSSSEGARGPRAEAGVTSATVQSAAPNVAPTLAPSATPYAPPTLAQSATPHPGSVDPGTWTRELTQLQHPGLIETTR